MTYLRRWIRRDRGSMAVEFVIAVPAVVFLLVLVSAGGQWLDLTGQFGSAARDAVRAASLARTFADAQADAQAAAAADLTGVCVGGPLQVTVQLIQGGGTVGAGDFATAQDITVTLSCPASLKAFHLIGLEPTQTFGDTAAAPLDPFEDRSA
jgi:Flp pilus assembly protein TadG